MDDQTFLVVNGVFLVGVLVGGLVVAFSVWLLDGRSR